MIRLFAVTIGGKTRVVELERGDGGHRIVIDGVDKNLALEQVEPGAWLIRENGVQTFARVDGENGKVTMSLKRGGADTVVVAAEVVEARSARVAALAQQARGAAAAAGPAIVRSPMPGRLVKVLVK